MIREITAAILILTAAAPVSAQWINVPLAGTPRTQDGKPNLSAPTPKAPDGRPDLSGIWVASEGKYLQNITADLAEVPFQPWAAALYNSRVDNLAKGRPTERCLPHGIPDAMMVRSGPWKIVQTPTVTLILFEEFNHYRQIFTDGRPLPETSQPAWFGYSIGRWDGDSFVVSTAGFNDRSWLDDTGHPHSEAMKTTERFRRLDFGHMEMRVTIEDPETYLEPFTVTVPFNLQPDSELIEDICENNREADTAGK